MTIKIISLSMLIVTIFYILTTITSVEGRPIIRGNYYDVVRLGARPDSNTDSSQALMAAWESACRSTSRSTIFVPQGRFLVGTPLKFSGKGCRSRGIDFVINGTIVAPADFRVLGHTKIWLWFDKVDRVTITGGVFDGQGGGLWACKRSGGGGCPRGATTLSFTNSMNVKMNNVTSLNSQLFHITINECKNVKLQRVNVIAPHDSPNTDGIHVQKSIGVTILNSHIGTGDDCISIGAGAMNLWMQKIKCGPGHGISIGSLGNSFNEEGVQNVTVKTATFTNTQNGVRIKSWGKPSNGFVRNIVFQNLKMVNTQNPIIIDQNYCPGHKNCPGQASGVRISNVSYEDIRGTSATPIAIKFDCSSKYPCSGIHLKDINLAHKYKPVSSSCTNLRGSTLGVVQPKVACIYSNGV